MRVLETLIKGLLPLLVAGLANSAAAQTTKPPLSGLVDMGPTTFYGFYTNGASPVPETFNQDEVSYLDAYQVRHPLPFAGIVLNVTWAQLEGTQNSFDFSFITNFFTALDSYNAGFATTPGFVPLRVKLRVWAGFTAPTWAMAIDGGPLQINRYTSGMGRPQAGPIGLWWDSNYILAWRALQQQLALAFDGDTHVAEVAVTSCMHATDEPLNNWTDSNTLTVMFNGGYTDPLEQSCVHNALLDYQHWTQTPIDYTFNEYKKITRLFGGFLVLNSDTVTQSVMDSCRSQPGCALDNHALSAPVGSWSAYIYSYMASYPQAPTEFQTQAPAHQPDLCQAVQLGAQMYHGRSIELWPDSYGYTTWPAYGAQSQATCLATLSQAVLTGAAVDPTQCPVSACPNQ